MRIVQGLIGGALIGAALAAALSVHTVAQQPDRQYVPSVLLGQWVAQGVGDCTGRDTAHTFRTAQPEPVLCHAGTEGAIAICWDDRLRNPSRGGEWCTYKERAAAPCGDGSNPGVRYVCRSGPASPPPYVPPPYVPPAPPPPTATGPIPLKLFWNAARGDFLTAASAESERDAVTNGYVFVRIEGYVYGAPREGTVPLKLYFRESRGDFFTVAEGGNGEAAATGASYRFIRTEGYIFKAARPGAAELKTFWSGANEDNFQTATADGERAALASGYIFGWVEGYVLPAAGGGR